MPKLPELLYLVPIDNWDEEISANYNIGTGTMNQPKCKICRRQGTKLFLKGERCFLPKCAIIKRPYPPGPKRRPKKLSEFGKELREKQILRNWYNLKEGQFKKYVKEVLEKRAKTEDAGSLLIKNIFSRLDNIVFSLGFASSRTKAKQLVSHGHFLINGKKVDIPSYHIKKGDVIKLKEISRKKPGFENISNSLKKRKFPGWVEFNQEKLEAKIVGELKEENEIPAEVSTIFEYYSR